MRRTVEGRRWTLIKAIIYRLISAAQTGLLLWLLTGKVELAWIFCAVDALCNTVLYYAYDRGCIWVWARWLTSEQRKRLA